MPKFYSNSFQFAIIINLGYQGEQNQSLCRPSAASYRVQSIGKNIPTNRRHSKRRRAPYPQGKNLGPCSNNAIATILKRHHRRR